MMGVVVNLIKIHCKQEVHNAQLIYANKVGFLKKENLTHESSGGTI
jgi:hypothetical protein